MAIEIVPCRLSHIRQAAALLPREEIAECAALGVKPRHILYDNWRRTPEPRAALANGRVLAVGGEAAGVIATTSEVWLFTTIFVDSMPISFVRALRTEIDRVLATRGEIRAMAHASCERSCRLLTMLGAECKPAAMPGFVDLILRSD